MSINNRPLTYSDEEELTPLTPALLISGIRNSIVAEKPAPPVVSEMSTFSAITRREKHRLTLLHRLYSRWYTEYLHDLSRFHYHTKSGRKIQKNDVVLIFDTKTRLNWQMGIVIKLHLGKDGLTRSVDVRTKNGVLNRPVPQRCRLQMRSPLNLQISQMKNKIPEPPRLVQFQRLHQPQEQLQQGRVSELTLVRPFKFPASPREGARSGPRGASMKKSREQSVL